MSNISSKRRKSNARLTALKALLEWEKGLAFSDTILHQILEETGLGVLDRSFVTETFYGVLRHKSRLDFQIHHLRNARPVDLRTLQILRLGLYQLLYMRVPDHAAVSETVNLGGSARGVVNALLRRAIREKDLLAKHVAEADVSIQCSFPPFLIERWIRQFGEQETRLLAESCNRPARTFARCNLLKVTPGELLRSHASATPLAQRPDIFLLHQIPPSWIVGGLCYIQDPSTLNACEMLDPKPGETILDACAAPGGKTAYLSQLMRNEGRIEACEAFPERLSKLKGNMNRLGVSNTRFRLLDWMNGHALPFQEGAFDRILVDSPCSNTGVLGRRVDARWRLSPDDFIKMPRIQTAILRRVLPLLKPGGTLVYSTCSLEPEENRGVVDTLLAENPMLEFESDALFTPHHHGFDGAYSARLIKKCA